MAGMCLGIWKKITDMKMLLLKVAVKAKWCGLWRRVRSGVGACGLARASRWVGLVLRLVRERFVCPGSPLVSSEPIRIKKTRRQTAGPGEPWTAWPAGQTGCTGTRTKVHATIVIDHSYPGPRTDRVRIRSPLYIVHMLSISCAPAPPLRPGGLVRVKANCSAAAVPCCWLAASFGFCLRCGERCGRVMTVARTHRVGNRAARETGYRPTPTPRRPDPPAEAKVECHPRTLESQTLKMREPVRRRFVTDLPGFRRLLIRQGGFRHIWESRGIKTLI